MKMLTPQSRILFAVTGLHLDGGISSVSRSIVQAFERAHERGRIRAIDQISLLDSVHACTATANSHSATSTKKARFALRLWGKLISSRPDLILFDHVGLARALVPHLNLPRPAFDVFVHGLELVGAENDSRANVLRSARRILVNSAFTAEQLSNRIPESREKLQVVPLCVEPNRMEDWKRNFNTRPDADKEPAALIVGRMWSDQPGKGHDALIKCWPRVVESIPEAELWIVGAGSDVTRLRDLSKMSGCSDRILFLGRVSDEDLAGLYSRASVFAMPSAQEGFGLVYLEAMWHKLPCIGSTKDAARCVINESCGVLVPYGDPDATARAIVEIMSDPERRNKMGEAARLHVERHFTFEPFAERLLNAIGVEPGETSASENEG